MLINIKSKLINTKKLSKKDRNELKEYGRQHNLLNEDDDIQYWFMQNEPELMKSNWTYLNHTSISQILKNTKKLEFWIDQIILLININEIIAEKIDNLFKLPYFKESLYCKENDTFYFHSIIEQLDCLLKHKNINLKQDILNEIDKHTDSHSFNNVLNAMCPNNNWMILAFTLDIEEGISPLPPKIINHELFRQYKYDLINYLCFGYQEKLEVNPFNDF